MQHPRVRRRAKCFQISLHLQLIGDTHNLFPGSRCVSNDIVDLRQMSVTLRQMDVSYHSCSFFTSLILFIFRTRGCEELDIVPYRIVSLRYVTSRYVSFCFVSLCFVSLRFVLLWFVSLRFVSLGFISLHYVLLCFVLLRFISLRYVSLRYVTFRYLYFVSLPCVTPRYAFDAHGQAKRGAVRHSSYYM